MIRLTRQHLLTLTIGVLCIMGAVHNARSFAGAVLSNLGLAALVHDACRDGIGENANRLLTAAMKLAPNDDSAAWGIGLQYLGDGRIPLALTYLQQSASAEPKVETRRLHLGLAYLHSEDLRGIDMIKGYIGSEESEDALCRSALGSVIVPTYSDLHLLVARAAVESSAPALAVMNYELALTPMPESRRSQYAYEYSANMARWHQHLAAQSLEPQRSAHLLSAAEYQLRVLNRSDAELMLRRVIDSPSLPTEDRSSYWSLSGLISEFQSMPESAIISYNRALSMDPTNGAAHVGLRRLLSDVDIIRGSVDAITPRFSLSGSSIVGYRLIGYDLSRRQIDSGMWTELSLVGDGSVPFRARESVIAGSKQWLLRSDACNLVPNAGFELGLGQFADLPVGFEHVLYHNEFTRLTVVETSPGNHALNLSATADYLPLAVTTVSVPISPGHFYLVGVMVRAIGNASAAFGLEFSDGTSTRVLRAGDNIRMPIWRRATGLIEAPQWSRSARLMLENRGGAGTVEFDSLIVINLTQVLNGDGCAAPNLSSPFNASDIR